MRWIDSNFDKVNWFDSNKFESYPSLFLVSTRCRLLRSWLLVPQSTAQTCWNPDSLDLLFAFSFMPHLYYTSFNPTFCGADSARALRRLSPRPIPPLTHLIRWIYPHEISRIFSQFYTMPCVQILRNIDTLEEVTDPCLWKIFCPKISTNTNCIAFLSSKVPN